MKYTLFSNNNKVITILNIKLFCQIFLSKIQLKNSFFNFYQVINILTQIIYELLRNFSKKLSFPFSLEIEESFDLMYEISYD
jgi:hypothetical protein